MILGWNYNAFSFVVQTQMRYAIIQLDVEDSHAVWHFIDLNTFVLSRHYQLIVQLVPHYLQRIGLNLKSADLGQSNQIYYCYAGVVALSEPTSCQLSAMTVNNLSTSFNAELRVVLELGQ